MTKQSTIINRQSSIKKVLIVDDSHTTREYLKYIINKDKNLKVVDMAADGEEAVRIVSMRPPDVVVMDVHMPKMDGYKATEKIMHSNPVPIVIVSANLDVENAKKTFRAMEAGAVAVLEKLKGPGHPDSERQTAKLVKILKSMSEVKVVKRFAQSKAKLGAPGSAAELPAKARTRYLPARKEIIAIGSSTGGPIVIQSILSNLREGFPVPILIVQHIAANFLEGMAGWLDRETPLAIKIPEHGEFVKGEQIYFAPDGHHMGMTDRGEIVLSPGSPENGVRPSVSHLFRSVAKTYGSRAVGVLLTGMGKDGAPELKLMKAKGAVTIAQDEESSIVYGMPGEAVKLGATDYVLPPAEIAALLNSLVGQRRCQKIK